MMERIKKLFRSTSSRQGTYSVGLTAIVVAIVVVANLLIGQIPEEYRDVDVSSQNIYEISDVTKDLLDGLDEEVTLTVLAVKEDTDERIKTFLSKYTALSDEISVEWIDPVLHPSALTEYDAEENSIVVSCDATGKTTTVSFGDIIVVDPYAYYYYNSYYETDFDGDGQLTSAVNYVTTEQDQTVYRTSGHGESTLSTTITDLMDKNNITVTELALGMSTEIPEDCDLLFLYSPVTDLLDPELEMIQDYLGDGGDILLVLGDTELSELPNLSKLMNEYGMEGVDGYIADPNRCYQGNTYCIFPELHLDDDEALSANVVSDTVLLLNAHGLAMREPARDSITTDTFMTTSSGSYAVTETDEEEGVFVLGAVATESFDEDTGEEEDGGSKSRFTVISTDSMIDAQITDTFTTLDNTTLFMNAVTANFEGMENISIEPKSLEIEYNTVQNIGVISLILIFGVPLVILIVGFVTWYRRRKA